MGRFYVNAMSFAPTKKRGKSQYQIRIESISHEGVRLPMIMIAHKDKFLGAVQITRDEKPFIKNQVSIFGIIFQSTNRTYHTLSMQIIRRAQNVGNRL